MAEYFKVEFEASGGNGDITWEFADENYPPGVELESRGILKGSVGRQGTYTFTMRAFDVDATTPDTAEKEFTLRVGPAETEIIVAPRVATMQSDPADDVEGDDHLRPEPDGTLDEACWDPTTRVNKLVAGSAHDNEVYVDAVWTDGFKGDLFIAARVIDESVTDGDRIVVYLDALNNREEIYNWDDRKISVKASDGSMVTQESVGSLFRIEAGATRTSDGYTVEVCIDWRNIDLKSRTEELQDRVIGFDIANIDVDEGSGDTTQVVWQGTARNGVDPSQFGALVLVVDEATNSLRTPVSQSLADRIRVSAVGGGLLRAAVPGSRQWHVGLFTLDGKAVGRYVVRGVSLIELPKRIGNGTVVVRFESDGSTETRRVLLSR